MSMDLDEELEKIRAYQEATSQPERPAMTIRDEFARTAMHALLSKTDPPRNTRDGTEARGPRAISKVAYEVADGMLAARKQVTE